MTKKCNVSDQCEFTNPDNAGLAMWVIPLDTMYDTAMGGKLHTLLSRADFWHLAAFHAVRRASSNLVSMTYQAGRVDPVFPNPGPRFPGRLPQAFAFSEMHRVASRNGMSDTSAAALLGAHTVGQAHPINTGFNGAWDPTPFVFDEKYWKALLNLQYHINTITTTSSTGVKTAHSQYSLGPPNVNTSIMLFVDMGMHRTLTTPPCDPINSNLTETICPINSALSTPLFFWATQPATFFSAFASAFTEMSLWGCSTCYSVTELGTTVNCTSLYRHTCKPGFSGPSAAWLASPDKSAV